MKDGFNSDPNREIDEILTDISSGAARGEGTTMKSPVYALAPFAALLVKLSRDADQTAKKVVSLTRALIGLTVALLALTVILVWEGLK